MVVVVVVMAVVVVVALPRTRWPACNAATTSRRVLSAAPSSDPCKMRVCDTGRGGGGGGGVVAYHEAACLQCCNNLKTCPQCGAFARSMHDESE